MKLNQIKDKIDKYFDSISPEDLYQELKKLKDKK